MSMLNFADTKATCHLAYNAVKGEKYKFYDGIIWEVIESEATWATGFKAIVIKPEEGKYKDVTVLAFAGSDSILDFVIDAQQATGSRPDQYQQAFRMAVRCQKQYSNLYLTGHSLGGGLAAYSSMATRVPANTINPAALVGAFSFSSLGANNQIVNFISNGSEFASGSPGLNPGRDFPVEAIGGFFTSHSLSNVRPGIPLPQPYNWIEDAIAKSRSL